MDLELGTTDKCKHEVFVFWVWVTSVSITVSSPIHLFHCKVNHSFSSLLRLLHMISREPRQPGCSYIHREWGPLSPHTLPPLSSVVCTLGHSNWGKRKSRAEHFHLRWFLAIFISSLKILFGSQPVQKIPFLHQHLVEHWLRSPRRFSISASRLRFSIPLELMVVQGDGYGCNFVRQRVGIRF